MLSDELMTDGEEEDESEEQQQILKDQLVTSTSDLLDVSLSSIGLDFVSVDE